MSVLHALIVLAFTALGISVVKAVWQLRMFEDDDH